MTLKERRITILCAVLVVVYILCTIGMRHYKSYRLEYAREVWETEVERICEEYGFTVATIHVNGGEHSKVGDYYFRAEVNCWLAPKAYKAIYECIKTLENLTIPDVGGHIWDVEIYVREDLYELDISDSYILERNGNQIYDALYWDNLDLREKLPYEGMRERLINYTKLGYPNETEDILYVGMKIGKKYYWYEGGARDLAHLKCIVTVSYYDHLLDMTVPGYVESVVFYNTDSKDHSHSFQEEEDPLNASDYRTAESFYDANYDAFFSFEDAESYYYKHRND